MPGRSTHMQHSRHPGNSSGKTRREDRRVVPMHRRRDPAEKNLESLLSSAMVVADKELGNVVREVDAISNALRNGELDPQSLRAAVHPAVWYAVKHVLLERELRHLALTDDLTCLYNRRGFFAAATQQLKMARRHSHSMLLFFCDLDHLKFINDSFGHSEGDRALVRTADILDAVFRDSDVLARLGGDEFAVLASEASGRDEAAILQRLEDALRAANAEDLRYNLSLSTGVARFDPSGAANLAELMEEADCAMYETKRSKQAPFSRNASL
jgi:diguanylate cyclase (GGDEF)-like protein